MNIAVLSGKGGTGKTLVSVNLAAAAKESVYIDCDVEEPNGMLFFKPDQIIKEPVTVKIPEIDRKKCIGCRKCIDFCKFNALAYIRKNVLVFEELCHSCGGCIIACPQGAVNEKNKSIGEICSGISEHVKVFTGEMNIGETSGVPIIKKLLLTAGKQDTLYTFIDCPPGSACTTMESIKDADYCILVAESTLFGLHNFEMVYKLVKFFSKRCGVILNKCDENIINPVESFCKKENIEILGKIFYDRELATMNTAGLILSRTSEKYGSLFEQLLQTVVGKI
ncbi:nucleotide-binding protein [Pectinatus sottacetonis]|uniref:nucleotide-binding protein n=1 Tax=Pectinatus sottacetonis TaxID=1002795 RepID=UPI0018C6E849|nr:ATP-binding protein [Pectinatus sottacetonis]